MMAAVALIETSHAQPTAGVLDPGLVPVVVGLVSFGIALGPDE